MVDPEWIVGGYPRRQQVRTGLCTDSIVLSSRGPELVDPTTADNAALGCKPGGLHVTDYLGCGNRDVKKTAQERGYRTSRLVFWQRRIDSADASVAGQSVHAVRSNRCAKPFQPCPSHHSSQSLGRLQFKLSPHFDDQWRWFRKDRNLSALCIGDSDVVDRDV
jgi:hypothetical protein